MKRQYKGLTSYQVRRINREWVVVSSSWNDLPRGVELTLCESIAEFAEDVSNLRQNGAKYADVIAVAPKPTKQAEKNIKLILDEITYNDWQLNIVESKYGKAYLSNEFGKQVYLICVGDFKLLRILEI